MRPFEKSMETLGIGSAEAEKTYKMLFLQKNYYEPISKIRKELHRHYKSRYAHLDVGIDAFSIYLCNKKIQLRHKIAVRIKAFLAGKKQGTEK